MTACGLTVPEWLVAILRLIGIRQFSTRVGRETAFQDILRDLVDFRQVSFYVENGPPRSRPEMGVYGRPSAYGPAFGKPF